jgi:hypothetical protein
MQVMQDLKIYVTVGGKTESGSSVFEDLRIELFTCQIPEVLMTVAPPLGLIRARWLYGEPLPRRIYSCHTPGLFW